MDLEENVIFMLEGCMGQRYSTKQRADKKRNGGAVVEFWPRDYVAAVAEAPSPARRARAPVMGDLPVPGSSGQPPYASHASPRTGEAPQTTPEGSAVREVSPFPEGQVF